MGEASAHAKLSPSSAERWMACPGSVALSEGLSSPPSEAAATGTVAHSLSEKYVLGTLDDVQLTAMVGKTVKADGYDIEVDDEMVEHVVEYRDVLETDKAKLASYTRPSGTLPVESHVELKVAATSVDAGLWGTADFVAFRKGHRLIIRDLKYGYGLVEVENNAQLLTYAVAVMDSLAGWAFDEVELGIFQPRGRHVDGPDRSWVVKIQAVKDFRDKLKAAVAATRQPNAPLNPGDHCKFCPAKTTCPALNKALQESVHTDFQVPAPVETPSFGQALAEARLMTTAQLAKALEWREAMAARFEAIAALVQEKLEHGETEGLEAWMLVQSRGGNRQWADANAAAATYEARFGEDAWEPRKLKSPSKMEKLTGKGKLDASLIFQKEGGKTIARRTDSRKEAAPSAHTDFAVPAIDVKAEPDLKGLAAFE